MKAATKTRTQRRMEKKQALLLLVLVLVVSLVSFTLGVFVGKRGAERDLTLAQQRSERLLVTKGPERTLLPVPVKAKKTASQPPAATAPQAETKLSFYDNLAKDGNAPLGSGINLPPQEQAPVATGKPPIPLAATPIVKKPLGKIAAVEPVVTPALGAARPSIDPQGGYSVQVGSFGTAVDAGKLKQRLLAKDYPVFLVEADLGSKGTWYRVRLGPYTDRSSAEAMQVLVEQQDNIKGFITRQ